MKLGMRKSQKVKLRLYADNIVDLNEYLNVFPGGKASVEIGEMELNKIIFSSMSNICSNQACVQGFYCVFLRCKHV